MTRIRRLFGLAVAILALLGGASGPARAGVISSLYGDKDGFGLPGAPAVPADGTLWRDDLGGVFFTDYRDAYDLANAPLTDIWDAPVSPSWTQTYSLGGQTPLSAVLDMQIAGIADDRGPWDVSFNGTVVGQIPTNTAANNFQEILLYSFSIPVNLLTTSDTIMINTDGGDGYSINFSELTITTSSVPEPSTLISGGLAVLMGLGYARRRRQA